MAKTSSHILELDHQYCWHPFTQAHTANPPLCIVRGKNEFLFDEQGKAYFDAASSWWVNLHGHCQPDIAQAIAQQALELEHTMFAGLTHAPAALLAQELIRKAPASLSKVFYSDNGSTAIEVALKIAFQYWQNQGRGASGKTKIIALQGGYHGDTFGAMAAGRSSGFYEPFKPWLFDVEFIETGLCACTEESSLLALDQLLETQGHQIAALVLEPLVQGASGMRMMRADYVKQVSLRCKAAGVLVIFDEVMTGFGRTGTLFAANQISDCGGHVDLLCVSKGLTGGFMPLGATLASQAVYDAFLSDSVHTALLHGHSYTANPLGCAAALANMKLFDAPETWARIEAMTQTHSQWLAQLACHPALENPRQCGTIVAFELKSRSNDYGSANSQWIRQAFLKHGILVRPLGNTLYWIAPYCTSASTLDQAYAALFEVLEQWQIIQAQSRGSELF